MTTPGQGDVPTDIPAGIGRPAGRALAAAGYTTLVQVAATTEKDLLRLHGVGPRAIRLLREALAERGLALPAR
ncbi:helix-hairpin-helix domain-containing protein [Streptosporangium sp. NPDC049046]|uniref:helix-hairpin-helix domain-containing protein n=1 Tax=unclassified Streptosporangium TaxID=2632669 RepID=UPI00344729C8